MTYNFKSTIEKKLKLSRLRTPLDLCKGCAKFHKTPLDRPKLKFFNIILKSRFIGNFEH